MATITITTTAEQDLVLAYRLEQINLGRAAESPPQAPINLQQMVDLYLEGAVNTYAEAALADRRGKLVEAYESLAPTPRETVDALLGLDGG